MRIRFLLFSFFILTISLVKAQEGFEIQVYGSATMEKNTTIFELHSNVSPKGPKNVADFTNPLHETLEITTGLTDNFELGLYFFSRMNQGQFQYTGSHIRPRIAVPSSWGWKIGASLSIETGFVIDPANQTGWDFEFRPIFDKTIGKHYLAFNPTIDGSFTTKEVSFSPNIKYLFAVNPKYSMGFEYYGSVGNPFRWDTFDLQTHQIYAVTDFFFDPRYEVMFGIGHGITQSSDVWNIKLILGRRVTWKKGK